jgi:hypothetical protein
MLVEEITSRFDALKDNTIFVGERSQNLVKFKDSFNLVLRIV